jgi:hypothetical protein
MMLARFLEARGLPPSDSKYIPSLNSRCHIATAGFRADGCHKFGDTFGVLSPVDTSATGFATRALSSAGDVGP